MTRREHLIVAAWGLGSAVAVANAMVVAAILAERAYTRHLCRTRWVAA